MTTSPKSISPIEAAFALTPRWMLNIRQFDALEIHSCKVIGKDSSGKDIVEQCSDEEAQFWTVFGHIKTGGVDDFEDFGTEAEAQAFHDRLVACYPHLAGTER